MQRDGQFHVIMMDSPEHDVRLMISDEHGALTPSPTVQLLQMLTPLDFESDSDQGRAKVVERTSGEKVDVESLRSREGVISHIQYLHTIALT
jgi:hypothetical protein